MMMTRRGLQPRLLLRQKALRLISGLRADRGWVWVAVAEPVVVEAAEVIP
jgi:hypothetical protein